MTNLSQQEQFDLDRLAEDLGMLPEAPLAMPVQQVESPAILTLMSLLKPRHARVHKAGH